MSSPKRGAQGLPWHAAVLRHGSYPASDIPPVVPLPAYPPPYILQTPRPPRPSKQPGCKVVPRLDADHLHTLVPTTSSHSVEERRRQHMSIKPPSEEYLRNHQFLPLHLALSTNLGPGFDARSQGYPSTTQNRKAEPILPLARALDPSQIHVFVAYVGRNGCRAATAMLNSEVARTSLQVAPLAIQKTRSAAFGSDSQLGDSSSRCSDAQMTPPATPNGLREDCTANISNPVFHNFLRAFYPFHPSHVMTDSTVTLPLNEGDVVLVHSIHTNGWADGTLLASGARGWLPTNYCEAYDPEEMRSLLKSLLNFWDLMRSTSINDSEMFGNQEFMKGIIAGVRYLLVGRGATRPHLGAVLSDTLCRSGRTV